MPTSLQQTSENQLAGSTWNPSFYGYNGHGNVRFLANTQGNPANTYQFDAFGMAVTGTVTTANSYYFFSGERFDPNISLYNLRATTTQAPADSRPWTRSREESGSRNPAQVRLRSEQSGQLIWPNWPCRIKIITVINTRTADKQRGDSLAMGVFIFTYAALFSLRVTTKTRHQARHQVDQFEQVGSVQRGVKEMSAPYSAFFFL
jgi:hypothetical protein